MFEISLDIFDQPTEPLAKKKRVIKEIYAQLS